ncbi:aminoglycoside 6'-acetyltransferase [Pseudomonas frederiksbergensis]|uniref:Aminoglycoside N(6')-acetyltransferase type 1 n=1 Tax=Pseudomonas frederiksbergensis TaxID=104087 RepID=A0A423JZN8_9PSED|nr:aminoglycoside 6'-N-acetyltransferase [Pseudomonas frederiksbergensis]RON43455.1 aminoglycoside 6'-acetyltransferase [Pseudomonas frederiksbergensis]
MIKRCTLLDHQGWLPLRADLWPDSASDNDHDKQTMLSTPERYLVMTFVNEEGDALGFAEASIRTDYVNGTHSTPVAFLEGLYVQPASRGQGIARRLVMGVQQWAEETGCTELASDALLDNQGSHAMHKALGFAETERVVYFLKPLVVIKT